MNSKIVNDPEKVELTLYEGVLNDDNALILKDKWYFKGHNKAQVKITVYEYATAWSDKKIERYFKTLDKALAWYEKEYRNRCILQGKAWLYAQNDESEHGVSGEIDKRNYEEIVAKYTDDEAISEWENMTVYCEW